MACSVLICSFLSLFYFLSFFRGRHRFGCRQCTSIRDFRLQTRRAAKKPRRPLVLVPSQFAPELAKPRPLQLALSRETLHSSGADTFRTSAVTDSPIRGATKKKQHAPRQPRWLTGPEATSHRESPKRRSFFD